MRKGHRRIRRGNEAAHHGDAVTDADLYLTEERTDEIFLIRLYGLKATDIDFLGTFKLYEVH